MWSNGLRCIHPESHVPYIVFVALLNVIHSGELFSVCCSLAVLEEIEAKKNDVLEKTEWLSTDIGESPYFSNDDQPTKTKRKARYYGNSSKKFKRGSW